MSSDWDVAIVVGSFLPALLWGVAFGNIVRGVTFAETPISGLPGQPDPGTRQANGPTNAHWSMAVCPRRMNLVFFLSMLSLAGWLCFVTWQFCQL